MTTPSPNRVNGNGRFAKGNPGGPGTPYSQRTSRLRAILLDTVSDDDVRAGARSSRTRGLFLRRVSKFWRLGDTLLYRLRSLSRPC